MFTIAKFLFAGQEIELVLPEIKHAQALYEIIVHDRVELARFLPWADKINVVEDEIDFIKQMRRETAEYKKFALVVLVNGDAAGMLDLHNIKLKNQSAEIGYWLGQAYQKKGIMTQAVKKLAEVSFNQLGLHRLSLLADHENRASCAIAERLNFAHIALLPDEVKYHGEFRDMELYTLINKNSL